MRILVTGGAGLIGRVLVGRLAARGHDVVALVHRSVPHALPGVEWRQGDVRRPRLGLECNRNFDLVVHCAAVTGFGLPAETYQAVNVDGTANAIAFARASDARLLHVSTAYVCGDRDGPIGEHELRCGQGFANGYEASKATAEELVAVAGGAIARPSIVTGAWSDGAIAGFGNIYTLLRMIASGRIGALPVGPGASLDLVPIDHVVAGLVDLAELIRQAAGQTFHLVSGAPVGVRTLCAIGGLYSQFRMPRLIAPASFAQAGLPRTGPVTELYTNYLQRDPRFQAGNLTRLSGRICPPVDTGYLRRLIDFAVRSGYLPA